MGCSSSTPKEPEGGVVLKNGDAPQNGGEKAAEASPAKRRPSFDKGVVKKETHVHDKPSEVSAGPIDSYQPLEVAYKEIAYKAVSASGGPIAKSSLKTVGLLGVGTYSRVNLVVHEPTGDTYALKAMHKAVVVSLGQVSHTLSERQILAKCGHPFIMSLKAVYQDDFQLYLLSEVAIGGELFAIMQRTGPLPHKQLAFYGANVCMALEYLHNLGIAYRDLKPENILVDAEGFVKICDLGFAKDLHGRDTYTMCGTTEYAAPEILANEGHNIAVDRWALGILLYEMSQGRTPFCSDDDMEILQMASRGAAAVEYQKAASGELVDLITRLLQPDQKRRLDCGRAREHALFGELDFAALARRQLTPPFVPKVASPTDTQYFEQSGREEEEEAASMQKMMKDAEYLQMRDGDPMISAAFSLWGGDENI